MPSDTFWNEFFALTPDWFVDAVKKYLLDRFTIEVREEAVARLNRAARATVYPEEETDGWKDVVPFPIHNLPHFPTAVLPDWLWAFVQAKAQALETPEDLQAMLVLGVVAIAVMGKVAIQVGRDWEEPLNLYSTVVLPSGERKTPALNAAAGPLRDYQARAIREQQKPIAEAQFERDLLKQEFEQIKKQAASETDLAKCSQWNEQARTLAAELAAFAIPSPLQLLADDVTPEALPALLQEQGGRLGILSDEAGLFATFAGRYAKGVPNLDVICKAHDGSPITVNRAGKDRPPVHVPNPLITLVLTPQPGIMRGLIRHPELRDQGLLARLCYSYPQSAVGFRTNRTPPAPQTVLQAFRDNLNTLLRIEPDHADDGQACPRLLSLTPEAGDVFLAFRDCVEQWMRPGEQLGDLQDWGNKLAGKVARFCGLLHLAEHVATERPWTIPVSEQTMRAAVQIGEYLIPHALAAFGEMGLDTTFDNARELLEWIKEKRIGQLTVRDAQRAKQTRFRKAAEALAALELLEERGFLRREMLGRHDGPGQPPSPVFLVNPSLHTQRETERRNAAQEDTNTEDPPGEKNDAPDDERWREEF
jgi:hypothetical protein